MARPGRSTGRSGCTPGTTTRRAWCAGGIGGPPPGGVPRTRRCMAPTVRMGWASSSSSTMRAAPSEAAARRSAPTYGGGPTRSRWATTSTFRVSPVSGRGPATGGRPTPSRCGRRWPLRTLPATATTREESCRESARRRSRVSASVGEMAYANRSRRRGSPVPSVYLDQHAPLDELAAELCCAQSAIRGDLQGLRLGPTAHAHAPLALDRPGPRPCHSGVRYVLRTSTNPDVMDVTDDLDVATRPAEGWAVAGLILR